MKLIDLLVQELPKLGGWPEEATEICWHGKNETYAYFYGAGGAEFGSPIIVPQHMHYEGDANGFDITREQYEAAIAASKRVEWSGEGLPPVGCEFEYGTHRSVAKCIAVSHHHVFASKGDPDDENSDYEEFLIDIGHSSFYPLSTEAERKREETINALKEWMSEGYSATQIYDLAIAKGEIPGIKLAD